MLKWALLFLAIALGAAGATAAGLDGPVMDLAKPLFCAALVLFVVFVGLAGISRRPV